MMQLERWKVVLIAIGTVVLVVASVLVVKYVGGSLDQRRNEEIKEVSRGFADHANMLMADGANILYALRGLFLGSQEVTVSEWDNFMLANEIELRFPNIYSFAYVEKISRDDLAIYIDETKKEADERYRNYLVFPELDGSDVYPTRFLHSTDPDISTLLGFDFAYSERTLNVFRKVAGSNKASMTGLTRLDLIIPGSKKVGYEVVLPIYSIADVSGVTEEERGKYLTGFLGFWINVENLAPEIPKGLRYSIYDEGNLVLRRGSVAENDLVAKKTENFVILDKNMTMVVETDESFEIGFIESRLPLFVSISLSIVLILWFLVVLTALTSQKKAIDLAEKTSRDLKKFKLAVDGVSDHVVITDPEGVILYANKAAEKITGYLREEMVGKKPSLWGKQMPLEFYKQLWHTIKNEKKAFVGEIINKRKNGEIYESESRISPILDDNNKILFFVGIERDLSKIKSIEKMKGEFISLASHQLRTPLSGVKWFVEMLLNGDVGKLSAMQKNYIEKIKESNEKEIQLVNSLLNVSRIESGRIVLVPKKIDLKEIVEGIVSTFKISTGVSRVIDCEIEEGIPKIEADPDLIKHVYNNLISNAVYYTEANGVIKIKVYKKENEIISEVEDNGIGIPVSEQKRIFDKFFRASNAIKKVTEGNGLGLYLVKTIIESSGGEISFVSTENKGSTFKFSLPIVK